MDETMYDEFVAWLLIEGGDDALDGDAPLRDERPYLFAYWDMVRFALQGAKKVAVRNYEYDEF